MENDTKAVQKAMKALQKAMGSDALVVLGKSGTEGVWALMEVSLYDAAFMSLEASMRIWECALDERDAEQATKH